MWAGQLKRFVWTFYTINKEFGAYLRKHCLFSKSKAKGMAQNYSYVVIFARLNKAPVAQLDRALPSGGRGREFESRRVRH